MNGTSKAGRTATEHREIPDDGLCMQHCQGGAGTRAPKGEKSSLQRSDGLSLLFSPAVDRQRRMKTYRADPTQLAPTNTTTNRTPARKKSDCANARCNDKEPTLNEPARGRLTRPHTKKTATADTK